MKIDWRDKSNWFAVVLLAGAAFLVIYKIGNDLGLDKNTWAAWVQAVGSIAAIFVAIGVFKAQEISNRKSINKRDNDELAQSLEAIVIEIRVHVVAIEDVGRQFAESAVAQNTLVFAEMTADFTVYNACADRLVRSKNAELTAKIIETYAAIQVFFQILNRNSQIAHQFNPETDSGSYVEAELRFNAEQIPRKVQQLQKNLAAIKVMVERP